MSALRGPKGWHSRGYLPHFDSPERIQHVVFRTIDSLPASVMAALSGDPRVSRREIDARLDRCEGARPLADPEAARIIEAAIHHFDGVRYRLFAWCVMPNHVHVVMETLAGVPLGTVVRGWKAFSAVQINRARGTKGAFWARDYFDRYMRNADDIAKTMDYVERNPVAAGFVKTAEDWPWSSARWKERA